MEGTASPRSEPLARFLASAGGAGRVEIAALAPLRGGAVQQNWGIDARFAGGRLAGEQRLVLRMAAPTGVAESLSPLEEFAVVRAAYAAGVTVPEPLFACADPEVFGKPFFVMRRAAGSAAPHRITRDAALDPALPGIAERLGGELARIHAIRAPCPELAFLPRGEAAGPAAKLAHFRAYLDRHPVPKPVLEWGIRWLETHLPAGGETVLCHHDFRTGNYLLDSAELTAILDWEFAGWGDPHEDIGWFCSKGWRFARIDREAGGIAERQPFYRGYERASGRRIDPQRVRFWEILASVRWAVIALQQSDRHMIGGETNLDLALTGRRASECELEILMLLDASPPPSAPPAQAEPTALRDLPAGAALLASAREVLLGELLPLLPAERQLDARLVGAAMAVAEREMAAGEAPVAALEQELKMLYGAAEPGPLRRFARDLRGGAFEGSAREPGARAAMWRLTLAKLREGNPRFLAANGFA